MRRGHYWLRFMRLGRSDFPLPHGIAFSHAVVALSIGTCFYRPEIPKRVWAACAVCSILPDIDVIGFRFGIHYGDFWAHRGFTHSLFIAALLSGAACAILPGAAWSNRTLHLVHVLVPRNCKSWCSGCHDRRRARSRVLLSLRQPPLLPTVAANCRFTDFDCTVLQRTRICRAPKRSSMDLGSGVCICLHDVDAAAFGAY
jgi:hypothetical protein